MKKRVDITDRNHFSQILLKWNNEKNDRKMPWKGEKNPYKIWLSEIILQQTRVAQGLAYYSKFIKTFPDIHQLAKASDDKVLKLWEGLGYYARCRNMHATAKYISKELNGNFPNRYESIKALKGVGSYTAAAIASFAFNQPYAVVDGNVYRVLARVFGIQQSIDSIEGKKYFTKLANELLDHAKPGLYNQAIMDFGASVCKPVNPLCNTCVFNKKCIAFLTGKAAMLPRKENKLIIQYRIFYFLVFNYKNKIAIQKRNDNDIWKGLYAFPFLESKKAMLMKTVIGKAVNYLDLKNTDIEFIECSKTYVQKLTHQSINARFVTIKLANKPGGANRLIWVTKKQFGQYAFPQIINSYLSISFTKSI
ncbi:MAG TPA: A/G-specific adenine glycosylase [Chitinophagaceae bacterium]|nr:A/G-specific adenine glycosylase [Chitinophagaceae bacterium]HNA18610.1 A/G-specific adenine glycosylase [Chitinophagaceae bacterium]HNJ24999.1 A/G-specific adenine glycosylase [Chitinophagaceae bacterium]HNK60108.1 A/G-specific adenine glycosylase [Chitinophagaceae bacterium]